MKRFVLLFSCIAIVFAASCARETVDEHAEVAFLIGEVLINGVQAEIGTIIRQDDVIITSSGAFCDVKIGDSIIRVRGDSKIEFATLFRSDDRENIALDLERGRMLAKPKRLLRSDSFEVSTPTAVAAVRGTQFIVEADAAETTRVRVYSGSVKVVKRVQQLEGNYSEVLERAPAISENKMVVVSREDVTKTEQKIETVLKEQIEAGGEDTIANLINRSGDDIVVGNEDVLAFKKADFIEESDELITVEEKPKEVVEQIIAVVKKDKKAPKPEGRVVITSDNIYYIKDGLISWQGALTSKPVMKDNRIYAASENYIFCADKEGPVMWRVEVVNDGRINLKDGRLSIYSMGRETALDPDTGKRL